MSKVKDILLPKLEENKVNLEKLLSKTLNVKNIDVMFHVKHYSHCGDLLYITTNNLADNLSNIGKFIFEEIKLECQVTDEWIDESNKFADLYFDFKYIHPNSGENGVEFVRIDFDIENSKFTIYHTSIDYAVKFYRDENGNMVKNPDYIDSNKLSFVDFIKKFYDNDETCLAALKHLLNNTFINKKKWSIVYNASVCKTFAFASKEEGIVAVLDTTDKVDLSVHKATKHHFRLYKYDSKAWADYDSSTKEELEDTAKYLLEPYEE